MENFGQLRLSTRVVIRADEHAEFVLDQRRREIECVGSLSDRYAVLHRSTGDGVFGRQYQCRVDDAGGCGKRIRLRGNADAHGLAALQTRTEHGLLVEIHAVEAHVAGLLRIEAADVA